MKIAVDLDNTIDANPTQFQSILSALVAAGHSVVVVTGNAGDASTAQQVWQSKATYLNSLGCGSCWTQMVVISHGSDDVAPLKAEWCKDNEVDVLIDNSKDNARAATASGVPLVLVPWATRI